MTYLRLAIVGLVVMVCGCTPPPGEDPAPNNSGSEAALVKPQPSIPGGTLVSLNVPDMM
ncbi:MAG: hypothetical protein ACI9G1_000043 [Pirellulaceae bacterium]|jgi:hypothetical protein